MKFHIRFTPYDISGYDFNWLIDDTTRFIVAREDKDKKGQPTEPHYHIYGETEYTDDSIRNRIRKYFKIPAGGKGTNNKYYGTDWKWEDISYVCKYDDVKQSKGFSDAELLRLAADGKQKYLKKDVDVNLVTPRATTKERVNYDKEIIADLLTWYHLYRNETGYVPELKQIVRECCVIVRKYHRGINRFKVRDYVDTVMFETEAYSDDVVSSIMKLMK